MEKELNEYNTFEIDWGDKPDQSYRDGEEEIQETEYISFSGADQVREAYLRWEECMDKWLQSNQILEEEKTIYAEDTLTNEAYGHWDREATHQIFFEQPDYTWEEMKKLMYEEFVEKATASNPYSHDFFKGSPHTKPRRNISITRLSHEVVHKQAHHHEVNKMSTDVQVHPQEEQQRNHEENPPDTSPRSPTSQNQGDLVLRTKPFEDGGYDRLLDHGLLTGMQGLVSVVEYLAKYTKHKGETNFLGKHVEDKGETTFLDMFQLLKLNDSTITQASEPDSRSSLQQSSMEDPEDIHLRIKALQMVKTSYGMRLISMDC